jgi:hypothetical protein
VKLAEDRREQAAQARQRDDPSLQRPPGALQFDDNSEEPAAVAVEPAASARMMIVSSRP